MYKIYKRRNLDPWESQKFSIKEEAEMEYQLAVTSDCDVLLTHIGETKEIPAFAYRFVPVSTGDRGHVILVVESFFSCPLCHKFTDLNGLEALGRADAWVRKEESAHKFTNLPGRELVRCSSCNECVSYGFRSHVSKQEIVVGPERSYETIFQSKEQAQWAFEAMAFKSKNRQELIEKAFYLFVFSDYPMTLGLFHFSAENTGEMDIGFAVGRYDEDAEDPFVESSLENPALEDKATYSLLEDIDGEI